MTKAEEYLRMYPELRKWVNQCISCQHTGYKPDLPDELSTYGGGTSAAAGNLRQLLAPLELNEIGLCDMCSKFIQ